MDKSEAREILDVEEGASKDKIQERRRELVKKNHPDQGGSDALFKRVEDAYEVLTSESSGNGTVSGSNESVNRTTTNHNQNKNYSDQTSTSSHQTSTSSVSNVVDRLRIQDKKKFAIAVITPILLFFSIGIFFRVTFEKTPDILVNIWTFIVFVLSPFVGGLIAGWYRLSISAPLLMGISWSSPFVVLIFGPSFVRSGAVLDAPIANLIVGIVVLLVMPVILGVIFSIPAYLGAGFAVGYQRFT